MFGLVIKVGSMKIDINPSYTQFWVKQNRFKVAIFIKMKYLLYFEYVIDRVKIFCKLQMIVSPNAMKNRFSNFNFPIYKCKYIVQHKDKMEG